MTIPEVHPNGVRVSPDDNESHARWVWRDTILNELRNVQQGFSDTAQLTTGITCDESQLVSLLAHMDGRAS